MDRCLDLWGSLDRCYRFVSDGFRGGVMSMLAIRDEVPDGDYVSGWNAYLRKDFASLWGSNDEFLRGFEAARDQDEASMANMREYNPED